MAIEKRKYKAKSTLQKIFEIIRCVILEVFLIGLIICLLIPLLLCILCLLIPLLFLIICLIVVFLCGVCIQAVLNNNNENV